MTLLEQPSDLITDEVSKLQMNDIELNPSKEIKGKKLKKREILDLEMKPPYKDCEYSLVADGIFRRVVPYFWTFKTNMKRRWLGRTLADVMSKDFNDRDLFYYVKKKDRKKLSFQSSN